MNEYGVVGGGVMFSSIFTYAHSSIIMLYAHGLTIDTPSRSHSSYSTLQFVSHVRHGNHLPISVQTGVISVPVRSDLALRLGVSGFQSTLRIRDAPV